MERGQEQRRLGGDDEAAACRYSVGQICKQKKKLKKEDGRWEKKEGEKRKRWRIMRK